jgi:hypothetical protein
MLNARITVTRESDDHLSQEEWTFTLIDFDLTLDLYAKSNRPTTRHKFRDNGYTYSRLNSRDARLAEASVPWPVDVVNEARTQLLDHVASNLRVGRWKTDLGR